MTPSVAIERLGDADRFLAGHGVGDEQDLGRLERSRSMSTSSCIIALVDLQAAGGVDDDRVVAAFMGERSALLRNSTGFLSVPSS